MATTMTLLQFSRLLAGPGLNFQTWQVRLMELLESAESISELRLKTHSRSEVKRRLYALHQQNKTNLIGGRAGPLYLSPPLKKR